MAMTMRSCQTTWLQQEGTVEPQKSPSVLQIEEQADVEEDDIIVDYNLDVDQKPEEPDPNDEPDNQEKNEDNSDTEYAKWSFLTKEISHNE